MILYSDFDFFIKNVQIIFKKIRILKRCNLEGEMKLLHSKNILYLDSKNNPEMMVKNN